MEGWRGYSEFIQLSEASLPPCNVRKAIDLVMAIDIAVNELSKKEVQAKYAKYGTATISTAFTMAAALGEFTAFSAFAAASGGTAALVGIGAVIFIAILKKARKDPESAAEGKFKELFDMFCVDPALLGILDNKTEVEFLKSDHYKNVVRYTEMLIRHDPTAPMPDFNRALASFLEDKLKASGQQRTMVKDVGPNS